MCVAAQMHRTRLVALLGPSEVQADAMACEQQRSEFSQTEHGTQKAYIGGPMGGNGKK